MRRRFGIIFGSILVLCMLMGCGKSSKVDLPEATATPELTITVTPEFTITTQEPIDLTLPPDVAPAESTELPIYTLNGDLTELTTVTALVEGDESITEQVIVEAVSETLADNAVYVKVNGVMYENDIITVDFDASTPPVSQVGASIEGLILDAFGQSLLDNIAGCTGVCFTVEGDAYSSGHLSLGIGDIYMSR